MNAALCVTAVVVAGLAVILMPRPWLMSPASSSGSEVLATLPTLCTPCTLWLLLAAPELGDGAGVATIPQLCGLDLGWRRRSCHGDPLLLVLLVTLVTLVVLMLLALLALLGCRWCC